MEGRIFDKPEVRWAATAAAAVSLALSLDMPARAGTAPGLQELAQRTPEAPPDNPNNVNCITAAFLLPRPPRTRRKKLSKI